MAWFDDEDLFDFDFGDTGAFDMGGFDIGNVDLSGAFDMGGFDLGNLDLTGAFDLGGFDLGQLDLGDIDFGSLDLGETGAFDLGGLDLGNVGLGSLDLGETGAFDIGGLDLGQLQRGSDMPMIDVTDVGGLDLGGAFDQGGFEGIDLGGVSEDVVRDIATGAFDQGGFEGIDLGGAGTGLSYEPGEGYGTGVLPGGGSTEDVRQFFGDVSGQSEIPSWARQGVEAGTIQPNYDGTYTQIYDDGSAQKFDYKGNVVETTNREGLTYDQSGKITSGPRTGETVKTTDKLSLEDLTKTPSGTKTPDTKKPDDKKTSADKLADLLGTDKKNMALIAALLGGLMGLLGKNKPAAPAGYKGSIPKYKAVTGPAVSPTAGGRRPGGAGIGSLTGGVSYVPAAAGGLMGLSSGGSARPARYLRGGTDGMADKIQTDIDGKQPARLSHGEFVIPADVVSHLGNGNSDAGADVLYDMMGKVRKARTGTTKQGKQINPRKYTPA